MSEPATVHAPEKADHARGRRAASGAGRSQDGAVRSFVPGLVLASTDVLSFQRAVGNATVSRFVQGGALATPAPAGTTPKRPLLAKGSKGTQVKVLQQRLNALGTNPALKVDADFGQKTHLAVVAFQTAHFPGEKQEWDGKVGTKTWAAIDTAYQEPEIGADQASMGEKVVQGMDRINAGGSTADSGVWYSYNYRAQHPEKYTPDMENGLADPTYFVRTDFMSWKLKPNMSASAAIRSWLDGLTIAECNTAMVAIELDTLRTAVGDAAFDKEFGSTDKETPEERRLNIFPGASAPHRNKFMRQTDAAKKKDYGEPGNRPASVGDWFYFMNHPRYLLKHPGGAWQGENSVYMGRKDGVQLWAGMGTSNENAAAPSTRVTEEQMLQSMVGAYNQNRDSDDEAALAKVRAENGGALPPELDPANGQYPEKLNSPSDILNAKPEKLNIKGLAEDDFVRKGGFDPLPGKSLDPEAVKKLRESGAEE